MKTPLFNRNRIDTILIYAHGMRYFDNILSAIKDDENFDILKIVKYKPKNIKKFINEMYSFDYAPLKHLKSKTKYLLKNSGDVCFIFIKNLNPDEDYLGENDFRHKESLTLKRFKDKLRIKYNAYKNGEMTHNHILHATDSESQTNNILFYLGYKDGVKMFDKSTVIDMPYYLQEHNKFEIIELNTNEIYCNIVVGDSWDNCTSKTVKIKESPHYIGLTQNMNIYKDYIDKYLGGALQEHYNLERYANLAEDFDYLSNPYETSLVIVDEKQDKFIVQDGLHRISAYIKQGHKKIKVCKLN